MKSKSAPTSEKKIAIVHPTIQRHGHVSPGASSSSSQGKISLFTKRRRTRRKTKGSSRTQSGFVKFLGRFWNGASVVKHLPVGKYAIGSSKYLSKSTQFSIIDTTRKIGKTGNWAVRFDRAHKGVKNAHVNINPKLTGIKDPHARIPDGVVTAAGGLNKTLQVVGKVALVASVTIDTIRIASAVRNDVKRKGKPGKQTGRTVASVGGAYAGGAAGAFGGNAMGAWIGGGIGAFFGGVGAVPGAAVGSLVGSLIGGIGGAYGGSSGAEKAVDKLVSDSEGEDEDDVDECEKNEKQQVDNHKKCD